MARRGASPGASLPPRQPRRACVRVRATDCAFLVLPAFPAPPAQRRSGVVRFPPAWEDAGRWWGGGWRNCWRWNREHLRQLLDEPIERGQGQAEMGVSWRRQSARATLAWWKAAERGGHAKCGQAHPEGRGEEGRGGNWGGGGAGKERELTQTVQVKSEGLRCADGSSFLSPQPCFSFLTSAFHPLSPFSFL